MTGDAYVRIAQQHSLGRLVDVQRVKWGNDIDRLVTSGGAFYCKTYTKPWYGSPEDNAFPVRHEAGAYAALKAHGLPTPDVVVAERGSANPLGRPYLLLRELEGVTIKQACAMGLDIAPLLRAAGRYLGRMHGIVFRYPGDVCSEHGPTEEPSQHGWRHTHWASEVLVEAAKDRWNEAGLSPWLHDALLDLLDTNREAIDADYRPPRMLHGDCHVDQFFFDGCEVTGVVDMEVASSGAPIGDLVKFSIEAASSLAHIEWWPPFFDGYGQMPEFGTFKLRLTCCEFAEFECQNWVGTHAEILERIFRAESWTELFNCSSAAMAAQRGARVDGASPRPSS